MEEKNLYNEVVVQNGFDDFDVEYEPKTREEILKELGRTEKDVMENSRGEYVMVEDEYGFYKVYIS